jgi:hypothetical protein
MSGTRLIPRQPDNAAHSPPSRNLRDEGISRAKPLASKTKIGALPGAQKSDYGAGRIRRTLTVSGRSEATTELMAIATKNALSFPCSAFARKSAWWKSSSFPDSCSTTGGSRFEPNRATTVANGGCQCSVIDDASSPCRHSLYNHSSCHGEAWCAKDGPLLEAKCNQRGSGQRLTRQILGSLDRNEDGLALLFGVALPLRTPGRVAEIDRRHCIGIAT